jgi:hypothetical protein
MCFGKKSRLDRGSTVYQDPGQPHQTGAFQMKNTLDMAWVFLKELEVESSDHRLELLIGDAQIPFGIRQVRVVELVHDES